MSEVERRGAAERGSRLARREALHLGAAVLVARFLAACGVRRGAAPAPTPTGVGAVCALTPEQEEGPFYVDRALMRSDVRGGQPGVPLRMVATVVDARTCQPIPGAILEIWSANAMGVYSAQEREGTASETWLRGLQQTDESGSATFTTVYPGLYMGRVNHIHVKVRTGDTGSHFCHTGQFFFDQATNDRVRAVAPYSSNRNERTADADDGIYSGQGGSESVLSLTGSPSDGFIGVVQLRVDPTLSPVPVRRPPPSDGPWPPGRGERPPPPPDGRSGPPHEPPPHD